MKIKTLFFLFIILCLPLYGAELIPQKVIIQISKESPNHNMELIVQKLILSKSSSKKDIYIFSDDSTELSGFGISQVNARVLLSISENGNLYNLFLTDITKETNIFSTNIIFTKGDFIKNVEAISEDIISILSEKYPPKEKKQLVTVETKKKKVSEFQKEKPSFSAEVTFNLDRLKFTDIYFSYFNSAGDGSDLSSSYSFAPSVKLEFEYMWFLLSLKGKLRIGEDYNYSLFLLPAFGLFGNLFFLGTYIELDYGEAKKLGTIKINITNSFEIPSLEYYRSVLGIYLRFNATKNYYFSMGIGIIPLGTLILRSNEGNISIPFSRGDGPPDINMEFVFRVLGRFFLSFQFGNYEVAVRREWGSDKYEDPVKVGNSGGDIFIKNLRISSSYIGLGIRYEF
ncbi:MAG: hypothetical protein ACP5QT_01330 [Brevinematia bacterium]